MTASLIDELVREMYAAILDAGHWSQVLARLRHAVDGALALQHVWGSPNEPGLSLADNADPVEMRRYAEHYATRDPWMANVRALPARSVVPGAAFLPAAAYHDSAFYNEFLKPQGLEHFICALDETRPGVSCISFMRECRAPDFDATDAALLRALLPSLSNCLRVQRTLRGFETKLAMLETALDALAFGVFLLDAQGRIQHANARAEQHLREDDRLAVRQSRLSINDGALNGTLQTLLGSAAAPSLRLAERRAGAMTIPASHRGPVHLLVAPFHRDSATASTLATAIVFIVTRDATDISAGEFLGQIHGLTAKERACAVHFAHGASLDEIGTALEISRNTVRTHLRSLFAKTGARRQSELAAILMRDLSALEQLRANCTR